MNDSISIYDQIGPKRLRGIIEEFYERAFADGIIGHFFFGRDHQQLLEMQLQFTSRLLGAEISYRGRAIDDIHEQFAIRQPHFDRRLRILEEVAQKHGIGGVVLQEWIRLESQLRPLVQHSARKIKKNR